jgi:hypothetical protein
MNVLIGNYDGIVPLGLVFRRFALLFHKKSHLTALDAFRFSTTGTIFTRGGTLRDNSVWNIMKYQMEEL